jgi:hypothetical protein
VAYSHPRPDDVGKASLGICSVMDMVKRVGKIVRVHVLGVAVEMLLKNFSGLKKRDDLMF